jgi:hypothetical protein
MSLKIAESATPDRKDQLDFAFVFAGRSLTWILQ